MWRFVFLTYNDKRQASRLSPRGKLPLSNLHGSVTITGGVGLGSSNRHTIAVFLRRLSKGPCMIRRIGFLALLFLGGFAAPMVRADENTGTPYVVAVGIDKFQDAQIKPRKHAEADAKAIVEWFLATEHLGVAKENVKLLLGSGPVADAKYPTEKATRENILKALHWLEKSAKKDDLVIFAIFGQGAPVAAERSCYVGVDSTFKNRAKDAVSSSEIDSVMEKLPSQRFVAMIDVHFLGFDPGDEKMPDASTQKYYREFLGLGDESKE